MITAFLIEVIPKPSVFQKRLQSTFTLTRLTAVSEKLPIRHGEEFVFPCFLHDFVSI
jgi:hypothetical protein